MLMESLPNHDSDGNGNVTEQKNVLWKITWNDQILCCLENVHLDGYLFKFFFQINRCIPDLVLR